jgi:hypothetical protein
MSEASSRHQCRRCGGELERGYAQVHGTLAGFLLYGLSCAYPRSSTTGRRFLGGIQHALFHVQGAVPAPRSSCRCGA